MKKVNALFLSLAMLLAFGCGREEDPAPDASTQVQPGCLVSQIYSLNQNGTKVNYTENFYDANRRLIRQNYAADAYLLYEYDASGLTVTTKSFRKADSTLASYEVNEYLSNGSLSKKTTYAKTGSSQVIAETGTTTHEYNAAGELIKKSMYSPANKSWPFSFYTFTYLPKGVTKVEVYSNTNNNPVLDITMLYTFDNQKAPVTSEFYRNNWLNASHNVTYNVDRDASSADFAVYKFSYQYNAAGYPIREDAKFTFTDGTTNTYTNYFDYNCQ